ncbi:MAG: Hpt domain-containing protein [Rhodobacterales bacterium]|nr:Hpt domain-containing protein [Rhodobacterales bacterium]
MIDWARITQLRDDIGEDDFDEIVTLFLAEVDEMITRLSNGFDANTLAADLHFLKGSALNLGFRTLASLCQKGESASRAPNTDAELVAQVINAYAKSRATFLAELRAPPTKST